MVKFPKNNNLEWLRLLFALQVVIVHASKHIGFAIPQAIHRFPGVPAFFFVSGFLIYSSYLNAPGLRYFENRFLRLFPALLFVTIGGAAIALLSHGWIDLLHNPLKYITWFFSQITIGQAYNPAYFRDIGVGVINGSLWTITTEILFYISIPLIVWMERRFRFTVSLLLILSFFIYSLGPQFLSKAIYHDKTYYDFIALTPIAWGWMFAFGILTSKHFNAIRRWLPYTPWLVVPMIAMAYFGNGFLFNTTENRLGLIYFICYIAFVLWFAFVLPYIRLNFDFSYGIYIWHMPVINFLLVIKLPNVWLTFFITFLAAAISWFLVEKPALRKKYKSLKFVQ